MRTIERIKQKLNKYRPDQFAVVKQMAHIRGLDITPATIKMMLLEEASATVQGVTGEELAAEQRYAADLKSLASRIRTKDS